MDLGLKTGSLTVEVDFFNLPGTEIVLLFLVWMEVELAFDHSFFWWTRIRPDSSAKNLKPGMAEI
jgi:hypothetical protein